MKRILALALALLLALPALPVMAESAPEKNRLTNTDGFVYIVLDDGSAEIVGYTGKEKKLAIPVQVDGHAVVSIGGNAFEEQKISALTVPEGVKSIKKSAFEGCTSLTSVRLPQSLTAIGNGAFYDCSALKEINLPDGLSDMGTTVFSKCAVLKSIIVSDSHPMLEFKDGVLFSKPDHRLIWYPMAKKDKTYAVPDGTEIIGGGAFDKNSVQRVILPDSVSVIQTNAFFDCANLREINLSAGITEVSGQSFSYCERLEQLQVAEENPIYESRDGVLFDKTSHALIAYPAGKKGKTYEIPNGTTAIARSGFQYSKLTEVIIPPTVKTIGLQAFYLNKSLRKVAVPEGVEAFEGSSFGFCWALTEVSLPKSLTVIASNPFVDCTKLKTVTIPEDHPALALMDGALVHKQDMRLIWYPQTAKEKEFSVPAGIRVIGSRAFENCTRLTKVVLPEGVEELASNAFAECKGIKEFYLPASLKTIDRTALKNGGGLIDAVYHVTAGSYAENFCNAFKLKTVVE